MEVQLQGWVSWSDGSTSSGAHSDEYHTRPFTQQHGSPVYMLKSESCSLSLVFSAAACTGSLKDNKPPDKSSLYAPSAQPPGEWPATKCHSKPGKQKVHHKTVVFPCTTSRNPCSPARLKCIPFRMRQFVSIRPSHRRLPVILISLTSQSAVQQAA